ncbi:MAG: hypothetical protein QG577_2455 [Thermodesulfobacteriota bacterium]|nr:hypothetical protein [Thermodesulfobacteriota bacterium]
MVFECQSCGGLLRLEEPTVGKQSPEKVVCPHCGRQGKIISGHGSYVRDSQEKSGFLRQENDVSSKGEDLTETGVPQRDRTVLELESPQEAFQKSRIMTNSGNELGKRKNLSGSGWIKWAVVSLAVICSFALLVNLILPGPTGNSFFRGVTIQEPASGR